MRAQLKRHTVVVCSCDTKPCCKSLSLEREVPLYCTVGQKSLQTRFCLDVHVLPLSCAVLCGALRCCGLRTLVCTTRQWVCWATWCTAARKSSSRCCRCASNAAQHDHHVARQLLADRPGFCGSRLASVCTWAPRMPTGNHILLPIHLQSRVCCCCPIPSCCAGASAAARDQPVEQQLP